MIVILEAYHKKLLKKEEEIREKVVVVVVLVAKNIRKYLKCYFVGSPWLVKVSRPFWLLETTVLGAVRRRPNLNINLWCMTPMVHGRIYIH